MSRRLTRCTCREPLFLVSAVLPNDNPPASYEQLRISQISNAFVHSGYRPQDGVGTLIKRVFCK